jgi:hypothetical protein
MAPRLTGKRASTAGMPFHIVKGYDVPAGWTNIGSQLE